MPYSPILSGRASASCGANPSVWPVGARLSRQSRVFYPILSAGTLCVRAAIFTVRAILMKRKNLSRKDMLSACDDIAPEDGLDPRLYFRKRSETKVKRKALQLCGEVAKTLNQALAWEMSDEVLSSLLVESVVPAPDCSRLLVTLSVPASAATVSPEQIRARLQRASGRLRAEVAAAIHRRRVPELAFQLEMQKEVHQ